MNLNKALLLAAVILTVFSCKKSSGGPDEEEQKTNPKKLLVKVTEVGANQTTGTALITNFTYDGENRLVNQKNSNQETSFIYKQGRLFQIESGTAVHELTLDAGLVKKISYKSKAASPVRFDLTFTYQGTKMVHSERLEDGVVIFKEDLLYTGENISSSVRDDNRFVYKYEYTYDDKKNVNINLSNEVLFGISIANNQIPTLNNLVSEKYMLMQDGKVSFTVTTNYEYTYDSEGYPLTCIKKLQHSSQPKPTETRYAYEYKVVQ